MSDLFRPASDRRRRGFVLVFVMVAMAVVVSITGSMLTSVLRHRRQLSRQQQLDQTDWLVRAGVNRYIAADPNDPDRDGLWDVSAALPKFQSARVDYQPAAANAIRVTATIIAKGKREFVTRRSLSILPDTPEPSESTDE